MHKFHIQLFVFPFILILTIPLVCKEFLFPKRATNDSTFNTGQSSILLKTLTYFVNGSHQ